MPPPHFQIPQIFHSIQFQVGILVETAHLEDPEVNVKIICKFVFMKRIVTTQ
jgi:hypothetical protein